MQYRRVCVESMSYVLPSEVITSEQLEAQLAPVYERLHLPPGRLELMTGIQQRRFYPPGTKPGQVSAKTARLAWEASGLPEQACGALFHGSVCRDQMEPATANYVHHEAGFGDHCLIFDMSNACLGILNGVQQLANLIELGQVSAGIVVGTEVGRPLVEGTIRALLDDPTVTRQSIKQEFASLTIGSCSAAVVLCDQQLSKHQSRLLGGTWLSDTASHHLCAGGDLSSGHQGQGLRMQTDSEALLHAGIKLAQANWRQFLLEMNWSIDDIHRVATHQVGKAHRKLLLESLGLSADLDFPTVEKLGNTGSAALPVATAMSIENGHLQAGQNLAMLGIGSGLNCLMLGMHWEGGEVRHAIYEG
jgi:3-oxoacyl-[acyl-carrier-protein] synthase-3